jgi:hypothetical protein
MKVKRDIENLLAMRIKEGKIDGRRGRMAVIPQTESVLVIAEPFPFHGREYS